MPRMCPDVAALGRDGRSTRPGPARRPLATVSARVAGRGWGEWVERFADNGERALHSEMAETIDGWPSAYRRWWWQTVLYLHSQGVGEGESAWRAYEDIAAQLEEHRQERRPELLAFLDDDPTCGARP